MAQEDIAAALERARNVLTRRPDMGPHEDAPATARWTGNLRVVASHANGTQVPSDMPGELGGTGDHVTPGWLFRAGLASCAATSIAMTAAAEGIALKTLEVQARSRSDTRGLLGMQEADGASIYAGPGELTMHVAIAADGVPPERLRALVDQGLRNSPIPNMAAHATPYALQIDVR